MRGLQVAACACVLSALVVLPAYPHCEIPCGIYDDEMRLRMLEEDITTIEKSMNQITELSKAAGKDWNQIVRWIINKEEHADKIADVVTQYFMTQRIKPVDAKDVKAYGQYVTRLALLHQMLVYSMKAKQTTDTGNVERLRSLLAAFRESYVGPSVEAGKKKGEKK